MPDFRPAPRLLEELSRRFPRGCPPGTTMWRSGASGDSPGGGAPGRGAAAVPAGAWAGSAATAGMAETARTAAATVAIIRFMFSPRTAERPNGVVVYGTDGIRREYPRILPRNPVRSKFFMALLPILRYPDPRLKKIATPVEKNRRRHPASGGGHGGDHVRGPPEGLAATQVNVHRRLVVIDVSEGAQRSEGDDQPGHPWRRGRSGL